ncbi:MAG: ABC transporter substrate-binding protein [Propioniciclava sp.]|uniref:ABC transporter substrate-binding protein n=1 Tax=Propioniciclava sp. TaxID=2038686 RepID=UPI0039E52FB6
MSRIRRLIAAVAMLALLVTGCSGTPSPTVVPSSANILFTPTLGLTYIPNVQFAPFYVAEAEGAFAEHQVAATLRHHGAQEGLFTALAAGQEQYVIAAGDELVQARSQGMDLVGIAQYYQRYPVVIIVPEDSPVQSAADLRGKKVGVPGRYGASWFALQAALADAGMTESDIEVVEIQYTAQVALPTGRVDAVVGFSNNDSVQFALSDILTRDVPLTSDGEVPLVSVVLVTTHEHLRAQPAEAAAVAKAMVAGIERTVKNPDLALTASARHIPGGLADEKAKESAQATLEATIPLWTNADGEVSGDLDPEAWKAMTDFMLDKGLIASPVDPAEAMTNQVIAG